VSLALLAIPWDPKRNLARIRNTAQWPAKPLLPVVKSAGDGDRQTGLIFDEDVAVDETIRVFGSTAQSGWALMGKTVIDGSQPPLLCEYDSLERMLADGWSVD
jgi:hypothetical protein